MFFRNWKMVIRLLTGKDEIIDLRHPPVATKAVEGLNRLVVKISHFVAKVKKSYLYIPQIMAVLYKIVIVVALIVFIYFAIDTILYLCNIETMQSIGVISFAAYPITVTVAVSGQSIIASAEFFNDIYMPGETLLSELDIDAYTLAIKFFNAEQELKIDAFNAEYCFFSQQLGQTCNPVTQHELVYKMPFHKCTFKQVIPHIYTGFNQIQFENSLSEGAAVYLTACRDIVIATMWMIFSFVVIFIFVAVLGVIVKVVMEKIGLLRVNRVYLIDEKDSQLLSAVKQQL